jgi:hypothetical protein
MSEKVSITIGENWRHELITMAQLATRIDLEIIDEGVILTGWLAGEPRTLRLQFRPTDV